MNNQPDPARTDGAAQQSKTGGEILASNFAACDIISTRDIERVAKQINDYFRKAGDSTARSNSDQLPVTPRPESDPLDGAQLPTAPAPMSAEVKASMSYCYPKGAAALIVSAAAPVSATVEQRHYDLGNAIEALNCERAGERWKTRAQLLANSEARAVAEATAELRGKLAKYKENWAYLIGTHKCPVIYQGKLAYVCVHGVSTESFEQAKQRAAEKIAAEMTPATRKDGVL